MKCKKTMILSLIMAIAVTGTFPAAGFAADTAGQQTGETSAVQQAAGETAEAADTASSQQTDSTAADTAAAQTGSSETTAADTAQSSADSTAVLNYAPAGVAASDASGYDSVTVSWSAVSAASGYNVYMADSAAGTYSKAAYTTGTSCTIHGLATGSTKYFKVESVLSSTARAAASTNSSTVVDMSAAASATPMLDKTSASAYLKTGTSATVKWTRVSGASGYYVYKKSGSSWKTVKKVQKGSTVKLKQKKLSKKKTHSYSVVPYRNVSGTAVKGYADAASVYVPKVLKTSTKTYTYTYQAKIIKTARTKLGSRYVLGASGPNRFDCSGFTYWVLKHSGVSGVKIKRTSAQGIYSKYKKYSIGRSLSKAQPGDLLLFGYGKSKSRIFHVGIYYGNGRYIHATTGGRGVTITKVPTGSLVSILRLKGLK